MIPTRSEVERRVLGRQRRQRVGLIAQRDVGEASGHRSREGPSAMRGPAVVDLHDCEALVGKPLLQLERERRAGNRRHGRSTVDPIDDRKALLRFGP